MDSEKQETHYSCLRITPTLARYILRKHEIFLANIASKRTNRAQKTNHAKHTHRISRLRVRVFFLYSVQMKMSFGMNVHGHSE